MDRHEWVTPCTRAPSPDSVGLPIRLFIVALVVTHGRLSLDYETPGYWTTGMTKTSFNRVRSRRSSLPLRFSGRTPHPPSLPGSEPSNLERITGYLVRKVTDMVHNHGRSWLKQQWTDLTASTGTPSFPKRSRHHDPQEESGSSSMTIARSHHDRRHHHPPPSTAPIVVAANRKNPPKTICHSKTSKPPPPRKSYLRLLQQGPQPPSEEEEEEKDDAILSSVPSTSSDNPGTEINTITAMTPRDEVPVMMRVPYRPSTTDNHGGVRRQYTYPLSSDIEECYPVNRGGGGNGPRQRFWNSEALEDLEEDGWSSYDGDYEGYGDDGGFGIEPFTLTTLHHHTGPQRHHIPPLGAASYVPPPWETPTVQVGGDGDVTH